MNRKSMLLIAAAAFSLGAQAQGKYTIDGSLKNADGQKIYLMTGSIGETEMDSTVVSGGKFCFKGTLEGKFLSGNIILGNPYDYTNPNMWQVAIEPMTITVTGDANDENSVVVKGGKAQEEQDRMLKEMSVFAEPMEEISQKMQATESETESDSLQKLMEPYQKQYRDYVDNYMRTRTDSYYATTYLNMSMGDMTYEEIKAVWDKLSPDVQQYGVNAKDVKAELETLAKVRPGKAAPDFTAKDINGKQFTLSSLKGKVVIIDFWASWCGPCRKSNPHMLQLYKKYHQKGLDMVYVSDDDTNEAAWRKAVQKDQLIGDGFHHLLRGLKIIDRQKYTFDKTNDISEKYAIHYLPTKYLIDKQGNIVCKISEGEDEKLDEQIEKLLK